MGKIYGYCRVSTKKQVLDRQVRNIKAQYPDAVIVSEEFTGTKVQARPEWAKLAARVGAGDTIVFDEVSRMARNAEEGFTVYRDLMARGVELVFLKEPHVNTATYKQAMAGQIPEINLDSGDAAADTLIADIRAALNRYMLALAEKQIILAFAHAEKEAADLAQRTREGLETARLNGQQLGAVPGKKLNVKKAAAAKEVIRQHAKDFGGSLSDAEVIKLAGISRNSFYKYKREIHAEIAQA